MGTARVIRTNNFKLKVKDDGQECPSHTNRHRDGGTESGSTLNQAPRRTSVETSSVEDSETVGRLLGRSCFVSFT
jgi:hypothetical protein